MVKNLKSSRLDSRFMFEHVNFRADIREIGSNVKLL
jgi:hypothetical protein